MKFMFGPDLGTVLILLALGFVINLVLAFIIIFLERNRRSVFYMGVALCIVCFTINRVYSLFIFGRTVSKEKWRK